MAVQLGIALRAARLEIGSFPLGKVAGEPLWLIPGGPRTCSRCQFPLAFILQVYSPLEDLPQAYHRYLYVFFCPNCKQAKVLRCQLPQRNEFFPEESPQSQEEAKAVVDDDEEISDERLMEMIANAQEAVGEKPTHSEGKPDIVLEIVDESHEITAAARELYGLNMSDSQAVEDFSERLPDDPSAPKAQPSEAEELDDDEAAALDSIIKEHHPVDSDVSFELFRLSSRYEPKQCIRYDRKGTPLWYSDANRPSVNPPRCELCGGKRVFEFQVMPQVIDVGGVEGVEFGSVYVFTCEESCGLGGYFEEFAVVQESL